MNGGAALDRLLDALAAHGSAVRHNGSRIKAQCPAHEDRNPSLSIRGSEGQVLVYCFAGCQTSDVCASLGLTEADLYDERSATYRYDDGRTVRRRYDDNGHKAFTQNGHRPGVVQLYRLAKVAQAVHERTPVYLVEGEKDVHAVEAAGGVATTAPMGATNFDKVDVSPLKGATVIAVVDRDAAGERWGMSVRARLDGYAGSLAFVEAVTGKDAADHVAAGHDLAELAGREPPGVEEPADLWDGTVDDDGFPHDPTTEEDEDFLAEWYDTLSAAEDRAAVRATDGDTVPPAKVELEEGGTFLDALRRYTVDSRGLALIPPPAPIIEGVLYFDSLAWLVGRPGCGKSFVGIDWAGHIGSGLDWCGFRTVQANVLYVSPESPGGVAQRVQAWEQAMGQEMTNVWWLTVAPQAIATGHFQALTELALEKQAKVIVLDTQARMTLGMEENSSKDMGAFIDKIERLRSATGACVLNVHHTPRGADHLRGSTALEGAAGTIVVVKKEGDELTLSADPEAGGKTKDTVAFEPIKLRLIPHGKSAIVAVTLNERSDREISMGVAASLRQWWHQFGPDPVSVSQLVDTETFSKKTFFRNIRALVSQGVILKTGKGNATRYAMAAGGPYAVDE